MPYIQCRLTVSDLRDLTTAINRCRWTLDLDADPVATDELLCADQTLAPLVRKAPGRRVPHTPDGAEFAIRCLLGQQVSTAAARTHAARLVAAHGEPVADPAGTLTHLFPAPEELASPGASSPALPRRRRETLTRLAAALAAGSIDVGPGSDWEQVRARLTEVPGIGPWTVEMIAMRALGDPDAFTPADLGVKTAARELGLGETPASLVRHAAAWRPWRAYAVQYLWATADHPINHMPPAAGGAAGER